MKVKVEKRDLEALLNVSAKAAKSQTTKPILAAVLLETMGTAELQAAGNDMTVGIRKKVECKVEEEGRVAVDAKMFCDIVRKLPDETVTLQTDGNILKILAKKTKLKLQVLDAAVFPKWPIEEDTEGLALEVDQAKFKSSILKTIFSVDESGSNALMKNVNFIITQNLLKVTTLDGKRISRMVIPANVSGNIDTECSYIIQTKMLRELTKSLTKGKAVLKFTPKHVLVRLIDKKEEYASVLVDGTYFNVDRMILPAQRTITFNKMELLEVIDRSTLFLSSGAGNPVVLSSDEAGSVTVTMKGKIGNLEEKMEAEDSDFKEMMIGLNPLFLLPVLKAIDDEEVKLDFNGPVNPITIRGEDYLYLILPVKLR